MTILILFLIGISFISLLFFTFETLLIFGVGYFISVPIAFFSYSNKSKKIEKISTEEEDEDIPHWIVITGEENGILTVNNPIDNDESKSHRPIYFEDLYTNVEPYQETTLISVGTKSLNKEPVPEPELPTKYLENTG